MEVHHHPNIEKKTFKEYFLEFLMIFLAVTMGFFAEGLRENINDRAKAKEYVQSFYEDLKTDTANISEILHFDDEKINGLSNISNCYDTVSQNMQSASCMFRIVKNHRLEHWIKEKLVEKNKQIRLAAPKRTIEKLESNQTN